MKLKFKEVFSVQTDEKNYKTTILSFVIVIVCISVFIALSNLIPILLLSRFIMVCLTTVCFYLIIALYSKLVFISENIEKQSVKNKSHKFKFNSIFINYDDLINWIYKYSAQEQIIIKLKGEYHFVEVSYDTKGRRGKYVNRNTYFDDVLTKVEDIEKIIKANSKDGKIEVFETYDHQSPQVHVDEIKSLI